DLRGRAHHVPAPRLAALRAPGPPAPRPPARGGRGHRGHAGPARRARLRRRGRPRPPGAGRGGRGGAVPLEERPADLLADRHAAACAVVEVRSQVDLRMGDGWERTADRTVTGEFELAQRAPGVELEVVGLDGNVIFSLATEDAADGSPVLAVDDD